jgi:hypothetical protein
MTYDEIYSQFYTKINDPTFFKKYSKEEAYELMRNWLHSIVAIPQFRNCFTSITLDDEILEITFELKNSIDEYSDNYFVKDVFTQGLVISWMQQEVDNVVNYSTVIGGKDEKMILNNYRNNMARLDELKIQFKKTIRDYGYIKNDYIGEI